MSDRDLLDAQVLAACRELYPVVVQRRRREPWLKATDVYKRLPAVTPSAVRGSLDRLEARGAIARRRVSDGQRSRTRDYVLGREVA
jgi:hypothetical protein